MGKAEDAVLIYTAELPAKDILKAIREKMGNAISHTISADEKSLEVQNKEFGNIEAERTMWGWKARGQTSTKRLDDGYRFTDNDTWKLPKKTPPKEVARYLELEYAARFLDKNFSTNLAKFATQHLLLPKGTVVTDASLMINNAQIDLMDAEPG